MISNVNPCPFCDDYPCTCDAPMKTLVKRLPRSGNILVITAGDVTLTIDADANQIAATVPVSYWVEWTYV